MKKSTKKTGFETPVILLAVVLFAFCVLSVILAGAGVYKRVTADDGIAYSDRTAEQYIRTRLRTAKNPSAVQLEDLDGYRVLCLQESIDNTEYLTCLYLYKGYMREVLLPASEDGSLPAFSPAAGEKLLELEALDFVEGDGYFEISFRAPGGTNRVFYVSVGEAAT